MNTCFGIGGLELHYKNIPRKIIATKYMENIDGDLYDYKFYCFNGVVKFIHVIKGRHSDERTLFYDINWKAQKFYYPFGHARIDDTISNKPKQLDEAIALAAKLSTEFPFVRVDLYLLGDNEIYFGEMTFTPYVGNMHWVPDGTDEYLGSLIELPKEKYIIK